MVASSTAGTDTVRELAAALRSMAPAVDDAERIERVRLFEELKAIAAAAQAVETRSFDISQRAQQAVDGVPVKQQGRGIAGQIGLARRMSPWAAQRYLGWAKILTSELPQTFAALQAGRITEWRATLVARETLWLSREDRAVVDAELAPQLEAWSDRRVEAETRKAAYRLDPHGAVERSNNAAKDRRVTLRPAPETMARLTALLPVAQGVATYAALCRAADTTTAAGDERGRGQIMADTLVERLTGQATAEAVPVEIELIMTDTTLFTPTRTGDTDTADPGPASTGPASTAGDEPGLLVGFGPVPAEVARELALGTNATDAARRRIRRLFLHPETGQLAAMESLSRLFTINERRFVRYRDQGSCRTPWCDAPIRHTDHLIPHGRGGRTHTRNACGACEACNYAKESGGWATVPAEDGSIVTTTPTGHQYVSRLPAPPGTAPPGTAPPGSAPSGAAPPGRTHLDLEVRGSVVDLIYLHGARAA